MFYRRKIILSLLQIFEGQLDKLYLQKLLFLFSQRQTKSDYDFIPYKYGCFSYSANADILALIKNGVLTEDENSFRSISNDNFIKTLKESDKKILQEVKAQYGKLSSSALMKHTYLNFPFYAINSLKAREILNAAEFEKVVKQKPTLLSVTLFTIGYEGDSLENYLNRLIKNNVKLLIDVRNNALSMKYGFSKSQLKKFCDSVGISYLHIPQVGIQSDQRQELKTQNDYDNLFEIYKKENLNKTLSFQKTIVNLLEKHNRIALTCFEANIHQCHRKHLADAVSKLANFEHELKHI